MCGNCSFVGGSPYVCLLCTETKLTLCKWHNAEYDMYLYSQVSRELIMYIRSIECAPARHDWEKCYRSTLTSLMKEGLDPAGVSDKHAQIMDDEMGYMGSMVSELHAHQRNVQRKSKGRDQ